MKFNVNMAPKWAINNRRLVESSRRCGCYYCGAVFTPYEVREYCDEGDRTVLCPRCGIDAVLGDSCGVAITVEGLMKIHNRWFKNR